MILQPYWDGGANMLNAQSPTVRLGVSRLVRSKPVGGRATPDVDHIWTAGSCYGHAVDDRNL